MASITILPAHPIAGKPCRLTAISTAGGKIQPGNTARIWCTGAPPGSRLRQELDSSQQTRISVATLEMGKAHEFTPDKGGGYLFLLEEIRRGTGFSGGYEGDPRGAPSETIATNSTTTLYVASPISCRLGYGQDEATLRLFAWGSEIIATTTDQQGLVTPTIDIGSQPTARARAAAESSAVRTALASMTGSAATLLGSPGSVIANLIAKFEAHRGRDNSHDNDDDENTVDADSYGSLDSVAGQREALAKLRDAMSRHMRNVNPEDSHPVTGSADYHSGVSWAALPVEQISASSNPGDLMVAIADTWRAYEAHRVSSVHRAADNTNAASALPPLLELHRQFVAHLADLTPSTPPTGHAAAALLANAAGFKDA